MMSISDNVRVV